MAWLTRLLLTDNLHVEMSESHSYKLEPYGLDGVRSDGYLYIDAITRPHDVLARRGSWFLTKLAKETNYEDAATLVTKLHEPTESDIVVVSRILEPPVHSGANWRSVGELGKSVQSMTRYVGFGFGSKLRIEREVEPINTIIVDPGLIIKDLVYHAVRVAMLEEADPLSESSRLSHFSLSSAIRLKSVERTVRQEDE